MRTMPLDGSDLIDRRMKPRQRQDDPADPPQRVWAGIATMSESPDRSPDSTPPNTVVGELDMAKAGDRGLLRRCINDAENKRRRWGRVDGERMTDYITALRVALKTALEKGDQRAITNIVQTRAVLEAQDQRDEALAVEVAMYLDKNERLDSGLATEGIQFIIEGEKPEPKRLTERLDEQDAEGGAAA